MQEESSQKASNLIFDEALELIQYNRHRKFNVIPFGMPRFETLVPGVMQENSYLVGAYSGDGKSNTVDALFLYNVFDFYKAHKDVIDVEFIYWSFELSKKRKILKAISRELFLRYDIRKDIRELQSLKKVHISDEEYSIISSLRDYFEEFEDKIQIFESSINPTGINKFMYSLAERNGELKYKTVKMGDEERRVFDSYIPKNENKYTIIILDHASLVNDERGFSDKQLLDKLAEYSNLWRNHFKFTPVIIQQFAADTLSIDRIKAGKTEPDLSSFGESKTTVRNFDVVLGIYNPLKFEYSTHRGYQIISEGNKKGLGDNYRSLHLIKDRDGAANKCVGVWFDGAMSIVKELPKPNEIINS